jgi:tetratricopeptide (TPR) repeat protein/predicted aspartyl protease
VKGGWVCGLRAVAALAASLCLGAQARAACQINKVLELPFTMVNGRAIVPVTINGTKVGLMADSGASFTVLDPALVGQLKLHLDAAPFNLNMHGVGGSPDVHATLVRSLGIGSLNLTNREVLVMPSGGSGVGVLGQDLLGVHDVEYDFAHSVIRLMDPKDCGKQPLAYWSAGARVFELNIDPPPRQNVLSTKGEAFLNGVRIRVQFDTGAQTSLISLRAAERAGVKADGPGVIPVGQMFGAGRRPVSVWLARFTTFKVGEEQMANARIRIGDLGLEDTDMLLGADFFLSHRVYVANSQHKLYFSYDGGPVFGQVAHADPSSPVAQPVAADTQAPPTDADGWLRLGLAAKTRRETDKAIEDFTKAAELAPADPQPFLQRAIVRLGNRQPALAMGDLDQTLKLKPDLLQALILRAALRLSERDTAGAALDAEAGAKLAKPQDDAHLTFGDLYRAVGRHESALAEYDVWVAAHGEDSRLYQGLFGRCWSRGVLGRELDKALADCNRALGLSPKMAGTLEGRAMVHFKRGEYDKAIQDYDAALAVSPKLALALYGRGTAEIGSGKAEQGDSDIKAARLLQPTVEAQAKNLGIVPGSTLATTSH